MHLTYNDIILFVHIPFIRPQRIYVFFFAEFLVGYLSHPVIPTLESFLCQFVVFSYDGVNYYYYYYYYFRVFNISVSQWFFHWSLSDSKSPQVSRSLLSILSVFNNAVLWMVSTRPPTCKSYRPFNNPLVTVPKAPITIGTNRHFQIPQLFQFSSKVLVFILLFTFFQFYYYFYYYYCIKSYFKSLFHVHISRLYDFLWFYTMATEYDHKPLVKKVNKYKW